MPLFKSLDFLVREPAETYHELAKDYLSSHQLADFRKCPLLYRQKKDDLIETSERPAYLVGRAAHTMILEGEDAFDQEFEVGGPINPKTGQPFGASTKAFAAWAASHGKSVLTEQQYLLVVRMAANVRAHQEVRQLLASGIAEGVVRSDWCETPCQIRIDWLNPDVGIADLKTADDLTWFEADARRFGYAHQLAFYRSVLAHATGITAPVHLVAVEKKEPYRVGVWRVSEDSLAIAQQENVAAIRRLKNCESADDWPSGYEDVRIFDAA